MKRCCEECKFFGPCISCTDPMPKATTVDPISVIIRSWIRWFPLAVAFLGLAFVAWTVIMVVFVGRYHDAVGRMDNRVKILEEQLVKTKQAYDGEYYGRQCLGEWGRQLREEDHERFKSNYGVESWLRPNGVAERAPNYRPRQTAIRRR